MKPLTFVHTQYTRLLHSLQATQTHTHIDIHYQLLLHEERIQKQNNYYITYANIYKHNHRQTNIHIHIHMHT